MTYTHAKDYLIEIANNQRTSGWLRDLIVKIINGNGIVSNDELQASANQLKSNGSSVLAIPSPHTSSSSVSIKLHSLTHHTGVCALAKEQKIVFSKQITLIYGKNGSGKSSYFRILNEMIGGNRTMVIRPNIYEDVPSPIDVELEYADGSRTICERWDGSHRSISTLNCISVFDSNYAIGFLETRQADSILIHPYGLYLFNNLVSAMTAIKDIIGNEIQAINSQLPQINTDMLSPDVKNVIEAKRCNEEKRTYIETRYIMSEEQVARLTELEKKKNELVATNYDDRIRLLTTESTLYEDLTRAIEKSMSELILYTEKARKMIEEVVSSRAKSDEVRTKIGILNEIGNTDFPEWKNFIESGSAFVAKAGINADTCPYCRQQILGDAKRIIEAYSVFLADTSISETNKLIKGKEALIREITNVNSEVTLPSQLDELLKAKTNGLELNEVTSAFKCVDDYKQSLLKSLRDESYVQYQMSDEVDVILGKLKIICAKYEDKRKELQDNKEKKIQTIATIEEEVKPLQEYMSISSQKEAIGRWLNLVFEMTHLENCKNSISTNTISRRATEACQSLISENLKTKFQEELNALKLETLKVELANAGTRSGQSRMELKLVNNAPIKDVLSEGEQKGIALALFFAEQRMVSSDNPIVLDDPVNSLDHTIIADVVNRLLSFDNQIIIFSHDIMLQTALVNHSNVHVCGINQLSSCKKTSKHLFMYNIESYNQNNKGMIYESKQLNVKNILEDARRRLSITPLGPNTHSVCASLRSAIELMVDEKILNNQIPNKFRGRKSNIQWEELKKLNPDKVLVDTLKNYYSRLSGGDLHVGLESSMNPINHQELESICNDLFTLY